jgi:phosphoribosylformylglycinamidine cyclo-ligase
MDDARVGSARLDPREAYARAGVDVAAGDRAVELMRERIGMAHAGSADLLGSLGGFAAALALPPGYQRPVLVSAADGVGTKTEIARQLGRRDTIGQDLVAMCADDVACHGASPFLFLDYVAVGRIVPDVVAELVGGIADGCAMAGCSLAGGETAEHPGLMAEDAFDLAGFCVGVVERDELLDGTGALPGDAVVGVGSTGLHANGYSLVRRIVAEQGLDLAAPFAQVAAQALGGHEAAVAVGDSPGTTLGEELLRPTRIYARPLLGLRRELGRAGLRLSGMAHVTGGGLPGNLPRAVPAGMGVLVDPRTWPVPDVIRVVAALGGLSDSQMRAIFNAGVGMALVVEEDAVEPALDSLARRGLAAWRIGRVVRESEAGPGRYGELAA